MLLNIINSKEAEGEAAPGRRRRREGGLLLRPIVCICNDQCVPLVLRGGEGDGWGAETPAPSEVTGAGVTFG